MLSGRARYIMAMADMCNRIQRKAERHDQEHGSQPLRRRPEYPEERHGRRLAREDGEGKETGARSSVEKSLVPSP